jgi:AcrR family transcriptional regulator
MDEDNNLAFSAAMKKTEPESGTFSEKGIADRLVRRTRRHESRRRQILACGLALFRDKGYQSTTMEQIAETVHIARTTLYDYFQSKEDILFSLLDEIVDKQPAAPVEGQLMEKLLFLAASSFQRLTDSFDLYRILFQEMPAMSLPARLRILSWQERTLLPVRELIAENMATGGWLSQYAEEDILFAYQALVGQRMSQVLLRQEHIDCWEEAKKVISLFMYGTCSGGRCADDGNTCVQEK